MEKDADHPVTIITELKESRVKQEKIITELKESHDKWEQTINWIKKDRDRMEKIAREIEEERALMQRKWDEGKLVEFMLIFFKVHQGKHSICSNPYKLHAE